LEVFGRLILEKVEPDDGIMEGMDMRPIDTEDLGATSSFLEIGDVVFGKLVAQVEANHVERGLIAHVPGVNLSRYRLINKTPGPALPVVFAIRARNPSIRARPLRSPEVRHRTRHSSLFRRTHSRPVNVFSSHVRGNIPITSSGTHSARLSPRGSEWSHSPPLRQ
jgi:hypothetical protein